jgi:ferric-dicitrate binding protein FerR (iron transport regulator)
MDSGPQNDAMWQAALGWVMALHESADQGLRDKLAAWLAEDPAHRVAYEEARRVWLLTGLVPASQPPVEDESDSPPPSTVARR